MLDLPSGAESLGAEHSQLGHSNGVDRRAVLRIAVGGCAGIEPVATLASGEARLARPVLLAKKVNARQFEEQTGWIDGGNDGSPT